MMKTKITELMEMPAGRLDVGDIFKFMPENQICSAVTHIDAKGNRHYVRDGCVGYIKPTTVIFLVSRIARRSFNPKRFGLASQKVLGQKLSQMKVSQLNPDGSTTELGECNNPEELSKFLPKVPPLDETMYAQALRELKRAVRENEDERIALNKNPDPRNDSAIEAAELIIEDCNQAIVTLMRLQRLLELEQKGQPLTRNQKVALAIILQRGL